MLGSIGGTVLVLLGVTALFATLAGGRARRWALAGFVASVAGNALILPLFGVAAFAAPPLGRAYLTGDQSAVALNDAIYGTPLAVTGVVGVLLYAAGTILFAVAIWRAGSFPRWAAVLYGLTGPLIGILGLGIGAAQTVGAALLLVSTVALALSASPRRQRESGREQRAQFADGMW